MLYLFMQETRKYPLEEMHTVFEVSTRNLASYRLFVELPYMFKYHVLRQDVKLEPFEESRYNVGMISLDDVDTTPL